MTDLQKELLKTWNSAKLSNSFLFYKVMTTYPEECKHLLEVLLCKEIDHIEYINGEEVFDVDREAKAIRLDVYLKGENTLYDIEIQTTDTKELPKRARYYQSVMDVDNLKKGEHYSTLKDSYIIFLCLQDIFGKGLPIYTFENICLEDKETKLNDRTYKIFYNVSNCDKMLTEEQRALFKFMLTNQSSDDFTSRLKEKLEFAKHNTQWRHYFMFLRTDMYFQLQEAKEKAMKEGWAEGRAIGLAEGQAEGRAEGRAEGLSEGLEQGMQQGMQTAKLESAKNMLNENIPVEVIVKCTGLSLDKVEQLKMEL